MRRFHARGAVGAVVMAVMAGVATTAATPAFAYVTADGPPVITNSPAPQSGPTAGGQPIRIYGSGFDGATSVQFGGVNATSFHIVDGNLITAVTPAASVSSNTSVDITVTDADGTATGTNTNDTTGYYYTNATLSVSLASGSTWAGGSSVVATVSGYAANTGLIIPEFNPLLVYLEGGPDFPFGPPPYAALLGSGTTTSTGSLTTPSSGHNLLRLPSPFTGTNGSSYDTNIACPATQATKNYLGVSAPSGSIRAYSAYCMIAVGQSGKATLETPITYTGESAPNPPVLNLDPTSASRGDTVSVASGSTNWNANPFFGSSTAHTNPGETNLTVQICWGTNNATCSGTAGSGAVSLTRYTTTSTTTPITGVFSGATLTGSIVVGSDVPSGSAVVKVVQYGPGGTQSISQNTAITIS